jgi:hypothetical protein
MEGSHGGGLQNPKSQFGCTRGTQLERFAEVAALRTLNLTDLPIRS